MEEGGTLRSPEAALDAHQLLFQDILPSFTVLKSSLVFERVAFFRYLLEMYIKYQNYSDTIETGAMECI